MVMSNYYVSCAINIANASKFYFGIWIEMIGLGLMELY